MRSKTIIITLLDFNPKIILKNILILSTSFLGLSPLSTKHTRTQKLSKPARRLNCSNDKKNVKLHGAIRIHVGNQPLYNALNPSFFTVF